MGSHGFKDTKCGVTGGKPRGHRPGPSKWGPYRPHPTGRLGLRPRKLDSGGPCRNNGGRDKHRSDDWDSDSSASWSGSDVD
jgi:hypothetical protein